MVYNPAWDVDEDFPWTDTYSMRLVVDADGQPSDAEKFSTEGSYFSIDWEMPLLVISYSPPGSPVLRIASTECGLFPPTWDFIIWFFKEKIKEENNASSD